MACDPAAVDQGQGMVGLIASMADVTLILLQTRTSFPTYISSVGATFRVMRHESRASPS